MVARILSGKSIRGLINYNESKVALGTAIPILANRFGLDIGQLLLLHKVARFEHLTKLNSRVKTNAVHIMLNFDPSEILSTEKLQMIAVDYMTGIGFGEQPFLVYEHQDANHPHMHIVTTNIKADSTRIDLHNIGKVLSEKVRKDIEVRYKLIKADGHSKEQHIVPVNIDMVIYGEKQTKRSIYNVVTAVLRSYKFTSFSEYNAVLKSFNVVADRGPEDSVMFAKKGLVYSVLDGNGIRIGIPFKASSFAGNPILTKVEGKFKLNLERRKMHAESLKGVILEQLTDENGLTLQQLFDRLKEKGISLIYRQNSEGRIYGLTYVDHNTRCVFNGSDLGKEFSAKAVLEKLNTADTRLVDSTIQDTKVRADKFPDSLALRNDHPKSFGEGLLHFLFEQPYPLPDAPLMHARKKKKRKRHSKNRDLSNNI
ncbi:relaxase/mobilization nuclease domain-containing protein [Pedobacter jeongneungensis]|uniref:relaxase/mobilization nuclease domain-containing protein n=1 Tax=Pedobacter jeongneungensis TaxID=947309 RepID=UPI0004699B75|nr:relaxase/mobilization nuclease domain-containing protein [Pedobacter jeongneungensis]